MKENDIESVELPESIEAIGKDAFFGNPGEQKQMDLYGNDVAETYASTDSNVLYSGLKMAASDA